MCVCGCECLPSPCFLFLESLAFPEKEKALQMFSRRSGRRYMKYAGMAWLQYWNGGACQRRRHGYITGMTLVRKMVR